MEILYCVYFQYTSLQLLQALLLLITKIKQMIIIKKKTQCQEFYFHSKKLYPLTIQCYKDVQIIKLIGCCKTENANYENRNLKKKSNCCYKNGIFLIFPYLPWDSIFKFKLNDSSLVLVFFCLYLSRWQYAAFET